MSEVQEYAKRRYLIAAAGSHNVLIDLVKNTSSVHRMHVFGLAVNVMGIANML